MQGTELLGREEPGQGEKKLLNESMGIVQDYRTGGPLAMRNEVEDRLSPESKELSGNSTLPRNTSM